MATPITISIPHQLGRAEARRRIDSGFAQLVQQVPGSSGIGQERWEGDRFSFTLGALGQSVAGDIDVQDTAVTMRIELPGVLGMLAGALEGKLKKAGQLLLTKR